MSNASLATLNFTQGKAAIVANVDAKDMTPTIIEGPPGCGKTALPLCLAHEQYGIPEDVAMDCLFRPSLRDPVDIAGLPHTERGADDVLYTYWAANSFIKRVNDCAKQYGIAFLIIDELPQAVPMMQNALAGLMLDRCAGDNKLDDNVYLVATGNRVEDKAGAGRILTQVSNRCELWQMSVDLEAWGYFMLKKGYDPMLVAYARFDPGCLDDFNPDRKVNGTMRSMEAAAKVNTDLPDDIFLAKLSGRIPEARAAQYVAFRQLYNELPSKEEMCNNPKTAKMPAQDNRGAMYAAASLAYRAADAQTFANLSVYVERIAVDGYAPDIEAAFYKDIAVTKPELCGTKEFSQWAGGRGAEVTLI